MSNATKTYVGKRAVHFFSAREHIML